MNATVFQNDPMSNLRSRTWFANRPCPSPVPSCSSKLAVWVPIHHPGMPRPSSRERGCCLTGTHRCGSSSWIRQRCWFGPERWQSPRSVVLPLSGIGDAGQHQLLEFEGPPAGYVGHHLIEHPLSEADQAEG